MCAAATTAAFYYLETEAGAAHGDPGYWADWKLYMSDYAVQILFGALLSAVTIFRREMSCNRVFHQEEEDSSCKEEDDEVLHEMSEEQWQTQQDLLDGAGMYCSGQPLMTTLAAIFYATTRAKSMAGNEQEQPCGGDPQQEKKRFLLPEEMTPVELLDHAGNFCSGEAFLLVALALFPSLEKASASPNKSLSKTTALSSFDDHDYHPLSHALPPDVHVQIASYLHPRDVVTLACVNKSYRTIIDDDKDYKESHAIWKALWKRDYAWVVQDWKVGQTALARSLQEQQQKKHSIQSMATTLSYSSSSLLLDHVINKDFYFTFGQTYLNYVLAGQNTHDSCLVGLHGSIYDITCFLITHPGSPDTLLVHSGRDATRFFEDMGHSLGARKMARRLCVVSDRSHNSCSAITTMNDSGGGWGLRPTLFTKNLDANDDHHTRPPVDITGGDDLQLGRRRPKHSSGGTLWTIRRRLQAGKVKLDRHISKQKEQQERVLGSVNTYYDPFLKEWRFWYTNRRLETVFSSRNSNNQSSSKS